MQRNLYAFIISLFVLIGLYISIQYQPISQIDLYINQLIHMLNNPLSDKVAYFITIIFDKNIFLLWLIILVTILAYKKRLTYVAFILFGVFGGQAVKSVLKDFTDKARPEHSSLIEVHGSSFPSGHATTSVFIFLTFIYLIAPLFKRKYRNILQIISWAGLFAVPLSRIWLHVHYVTDIIAGIALGVASFTFTIILFRFIVTNIYKREYNQLPALFKRKSSIV